MRTKRLGVIPCVLLVTMGLAAPAALAADTGGAVAVAPVPPTKAATTPVVHGAPVTAKTPSPAYKGPVYEKTAAGTIVPYVSPNAAAASAAQATVSSGGSPATVPAAAPPALAASESPTPVKPELLVPGSRARLVNGLAAAPMAAPAQIQQIVWAGNELIGLPYVYGGGHASWISAGYDCSGTVSFALHGASLLTTPMDSGEFEGWGSTGVGRWVTVFANAGHAYMTIAGLRLDTSSADDPSNEQGPRWRPLRPANEGFVVRHPTGF